MPDNAPTQKPKRATTLTPQAAAARLGVSVSTIKRWVDQGRLGATRTAGGHRRIARAEVERLAFELGEAWTDAAPQAPDDQAPGSTYHLLTQGAEAALREQMQTQLHNGRLIEDLIDEELAPAMQRIGQLWQTGRTGIGTEHVATVTAERTLAGLVASLKSPPGGQPLAVGAADADDAHALPCHMAATVLEIKGWRTENLGGFCPVTVLADRAREQGADLVWLAISQAVPADLAAARAAELRTALGHGPGTPQLVLGGPGTTEVGKHLLPRGVRLGQSMADLVKVASSAP